MTGTTKAFLNTLALRRLQETERCQRCSFLASKVSCVYIYLLLLHTNDVVCDSMVVKVQIYGMQHQQQIVTCILSQQYRWDCVRSWGVFWCSHTGRSWQFNFTRFHRHYWVQLRVVTSKTSYALLNLTWRQLPMVLFIYINTIADIFQYEYWTGPGHWVQFYERLLGLSGIWVQARRGP